MEIGDSYWEATNTQDVLFVEYRRRRVAYSCWKLAGNRGLESAGYFIGVQRRTRTYIRALMRYPV